MKNVVQSFDFIVTGRDRSQVFKSDNGSESVDKALDQRPHEQRVGLNFNRTGRPADNAVVERFNGRLRQECLNALWLMSLGDPEKKIEVWRSQSNESQSHSALGW